MRSLILVALAAGGSALAFGGARAELGSVFGLVTSVLWVVPGFVCLHLGQLFLAGTAWRALFVGGAPARLIFYRLRIIREAIDSLLPVAQVGGEIVGARLLAGHGVPTARAAASVVVDVTVELLTQLVFLLAGLAGMLLLVRAPGLSVWARVAPAVGALAVAFVLAQRFGILRAVEHLSRGVAVRWPGLAVPLDGLNAAARAFYRRPGPMLRNACLHLLAWALGSLEAWGVLHALGVAASPLQAFCIESLGMAARSAGFAIPAALGAQEGGFVLAAAALGFAAGPALALSLVKRLREVLVGLVGMTLWRCAPRPVAP